MSHTLRWTSINMNQDHGSSIACSKATEARALLVLQCRVINGVDTNRSYNVSVIIEAYCIRMEAYIVVVPVHSLNVDTTQLVQVEEITNLAAKL